MIKYVKAIIVSSIVVIALSSCEKAKTAKSTDCAILTFKIEEYPDAKIIIGESEIRIELPLSATDLNLTPVYTVSENASATPVSGEKVNFGAGILFVVTAQNTSYYSYYKAYVTYPIVSDALSELNLEDNQAVVNTPFSLAYTSFSASSVGTDPWRGFGYSNKIYDSNASASPQELELTSYNNVSESQKNYLLVRAQNVALEQVDTAKITLERIANIDTIRVNPSALLAQTEFNSGDYLYLFFEGYDKDGKLITNAVKQFIVADYTFEGREFFKTSWQVIDFAVSKFKSVKTIKIYSKSNIQSLSPVFAIDKISYTIQPEYVP